MSGFRFEREREVRKGRMVSSEESRIVNKSLTILS